jgi:prepilin-type processing-associated H-X9-DG protein
LFVCPKDKGTAAFRPEKYGIGAGRFDGLWDFGPDPARHCSYAYHMPYGRYALTTSSEPGRAVAADRNLWIDAPRQKAAEFSLFQPDIASFSGTIEEARRGNSRAHRSEGQNVLFLDSHVEFAKRAYAGLRDDNVYTTWDGTDAIRGIPPKPYGSQPANEFDSLLVNDPPLGR